jgi:hypothetical protein
MTNALARPSPPHLIAPSRTRLSALRASAA